MVLTPMTCAVMDCNDNSHVFEHFALVQKDIWRDTWSIGSEVEQLGIECVEDDLVLFMLP